MPEAPPPTRAGQPSAQQTAKPHFRGYEECLGDIRKLSYCMVLALSWRLTYGLVPVPPKQQILDSDLRDRTGGGFEIINNILVKTVGVEIAVHNTPAGET